MNDGNVISVGDTVMWRGCWGQDEAKPAKIIDMQLCEEDRMKYGIDVEKAYLRDKNRLCVVLDNNAWAYGFQIEPLGGK